jgi:hypothetical protein
VGLSFVPTVSSAWARQCFDEASADRIGDLHEHDWYDIRRLQQRAYRPIG